MMGTFFIIDDHISGLPLDVVVEHCEMAKDAILHAGTPRPDGEHVIGEITRQYVLPGSAFKFCRAHLP
jgi:hypothetical protein